MTTDTEKQQLRKTMRRLASQLSPRYRAAADEAIARHLLSLPEYRSAGTVFCGRSIPAPFWSGPWPTAGRCASPCAWRTGSWSCGPSGT